MKRYLGLLILGLVCLLLGPAAGFTPTPPAGPGAHGIGQPDPQPLIAGRNPGEEPFLSPGPLAHSFPRLDHSSPQEFAAQFVIPVVFGSYGLGVEDFPVIFALEIGFDQFLRAPPAELLG